MATKRNAVLWVAHLVVFSLLTSETAWAVRPGEVSWTAELTCSYRAIAALHPDPKLRNPDDLAGRFLEDTSSDPANSKSYTAQNYPMVIEGDYAEFYGAEGAAAKVASMGEPYIFGMTQREAATFVARHGFKLVSDLGTDDLTDSYLIGSDG